MATSKQVNSDSTTNSSANSNASSSGSNNATTSGPSWLTDAAQNNLTNAANLQSTGFTPYTGTQVASFSPQQQSSFGLGSDLASSVNGGPIGSAVNNYMTAGPQSVTPETISQNMSPYMNQYVNMALAPQIQAQDLQFAGQNKAIDAAATGAGAFGDTGWGQLRGTTTQAQDAARTGLVGNAYNAAFNTAIGAGAQDVSNKLNAGTTNANLAETALGRQLTGATTDSGLLTNATNVNNTLGAQQTAQGQAGLNAAYNQWQMAQQYPFLTSQNTNQAIAASTPAAGHTSTGTTTGATTGTTTGQQATTGQQTTMAPDNSGYGLLGSLGSGLLAFAADGGAVPAGAPTLVGERGPEVIVPNSNSVVIPAEVLQAAREKRDGKNGAQPSTMKFGIAA